MNYLNNFFEFSFFFQISLPLNEVTVDCWHTSKGETQSLYHFNPIEEFKATAAITRLTRSHVINDHPGYEPTLAMGTVTLNIQHTITNDSSNSPTQVATPTTGNVQDKSMTSSSESSGGSPTSRCDEKSLANQIADELVEQKATEIELEKKNWNGIAGAGVGFEDVEDDGTTHKFVNITFTETVICQSCNKKVIIFKFEI